MCTKINTLFILNLLASSALVSAQEEHVQDMSDPLAVYTQVGFGVTDKGLNFKFGQAYDTGSSTTMGMSIIELKGVAGEQFGGQAPISEIILSIALVSVILTLI